MFNGLSAMHAFGAQMCTCRWDQICREHAHMPNTHGVWEEGRVVHSLWWWWLGSVPTATSKAASATSFLLSRLSMEGGLLQLSWTATFIGCNHEHE